MDDTLTYNPQLFGELALDALAQSYFGLGDFATAADLWSELGRSYEDSEYRVAVGSAQIEC